MKREVIWTWAAEMDAQEAFVQMEEAVEGSGLPDPTRRPTHPTFEGIPSHGYSLAFPHPESWITENEIRIVLCPRIHPARHHRCAGPPRSSRPAQP